MNHKNALFPLGRVCCTPGALEELSRLSVHPIQLLARHVTGDFGDLCAEDTAANLAAIVDRTRLLSSYELAPGAKVWVITEADRSATTVLLPSEY